MSCKPTYKGKRYNSLEELYRANGVNEQQKQQAQQIYSQYLDTIFPDSKVKDIVYHGTSKDFTSFIKGKQVTPKGRTKGGIWFTDFANADWVYKEEDGKVIPALINVKNPIEYNTERYFDKQYGDSLPTKELKEGQWKDVQKLLDDRKGDGLLLNIFDATTSGDVGEFTKQQVVFEPEQIHILGSKQDMEGFKAFVESNNTKTNNSELIDKNTESEIKPIVDAENKTIKNNYETFKEVQDFFDSNLSTMDNVYNAIFNNSEITPDDIIKQIIKTDNVEKECNGGVSDSNWEIV